MHGAACLAGRRQAGARGEVGAARRVGAGVADRSGPRPRSRSATASRRASTSARSARPAPRSIQRARNPPPNASPRRPCRRPRPAGPRPRRSRSSSRPGPDAAPSVTRTTDGPRSRIARAAGRGRPLRGEIGQIVDADLDDVGARHDALQAIEIGRAVADDPRPAVRIEHDQRLDADAPRSPPQAPSPSAPGRARACRGGRLAAGSRGPPRPPHATARRRRVGRVEPVGRGTRRHRARRWPASSARPSVRPATGRRRTRRARRAGCRRTDRSRAARGTRPGHRAVRSSAPC